MSDTRLKRLQEVAQVAASLLEANGPCDGITEEMPEAHHCGEPCWYCELNRLVSALPYAELRGRKTQPPDPDLRCTHDVIDRHVYQEDKHPDDCRCEGAGWVWRHELPSDGDPDLSGAMIIDDTRYPCPRQED